jgi:formylglycine-generating enzyme required for sulfatase activity
MNRVIQSALVALPIVLAVFSSLPTGGEGPGVRGQPATKYPLIESAKHAKYTEKLNENVSFEMVPIPGGTYLMGSPDDEKGRDANEGPQHPVSVKPFWMAKLEITWDEYDIYWENRPKGPPPRPKISEKPPPLTDAITSPTPPYEDPTFGFGKEGHPVIAVTHHADRHRVSGQSCIPADPGAKLDCVDNPLHWNAIDSPVGGNAKDRPGCDRSIVENPPPCRNGRAADDRAPM